MTSRRTLGLLVLAPLAFACGGDGLGGTAGPDGDGTTGNLLVTVVVGDWRQAGVGVTLTGPGGVHSALTNSDGRAGFVDIPVGVYTLALTDLDPDARLDAGTPDQVEVVAARTGEVEVTGTFDPGRFVSVSKGSTFTCGLNENGNAYCWGIGERGELGHGGLGLQGFPVRVRSPMRFRTLGSGHAHSCALAANDEAWCWGWNRSGRLGVGRRFDELTHSALPVRVAGSTRFDELAVGRSTTCGLERSVGRVHCWGSADFGLLGSDRSEPATSPRPVTSTRRFVHVTAEDGWSEDRAMAALTDQGEVWVWGAVIEDFRSWHAFPSSVPVRLPLPAGASVETLTGLCARLDDGRTLCWPDIEGEVPQEVLDQFRPTESPGIHEYLVEGLEPSFFAAGLPCTPGAEGLVCLQDWFLSLPALSFGGETVLAVDTRGYGGCVVTDVGRAWCWDDGGFVARPVSLGR